MAPEPPRPGKLRNQRSERVWVGVRGGRPESRNMAAEPPRPGKLRNQRSERVWVGVRGGRPESRNMAAEPPRPGKLRNQRSQRVWVGFRGGRTGIPKYGRGAAEAGTAPKSTISASLSGGPRRASRNPEMWPRSRRGRDASEINDLSESGWGSTEGVPESRNMAAEPPRPGKAPNSTISASLGGVPMEIVRK